MKFRRAQKQGNSQNRTSDIGKDRYKMKDNNDGKKGNTDLSKIKCYKYDKMGHFATDCINANNDKDKSKALIFSSKN